MPAFQNFTADRMSLVTPPSSNGWNIPLNLSYTKVFYVAIIIIKTTWSSSKGCLFNLTKTGRIKYNCFGFRKNKVSKELVSAINRGKGCFGNFDLFSFLPHWNLYDKFTPFLITQLWKWSISFQADMAYYNHNYHVLCYSNTTGTKWST